jgi:flagellar hook-length control protein FliK
MQMMMNEMSSASAAPKSAPSKADNNSSKSDDKSFQDSLDAKKQTDLENQKADADNQQSATNVAAYAAAAPAPVANAQAEIAFVMEVAMAQVDPNQGSTNAVQQALQELNQSMQQNAAQADIPVADLIQQIEDATAQQAQNKPSDVKVEVQVNSQVSLQLLAQQEAGSQAAVLGLQQTDVKSQAGPAEKLVLPVPEKTAPAVDAIAEKAAAAAQIQAARPNFLSQLNMMQNQENSDKTTLILNQLTDKMKTAVDAGKDVVKIQLQPENMGKVDVRIVRGSDGVQFYFTADTAATSRTLQASLNQLHQSLLDAGVKVGNMSVSYQGQPGQQNSQGQPQRKNGFSFFGQDDSELVADYSKSGALSALDTRA